MDWSDAMQQSSYSMLKTGANRSQACLKVIMSKCLTVSLLPHSRPPNLSIAYVLNLGLGDGVRKNWCTFSPRVRFPSSNSPCSVSLRRCTCAWAVLFQQGTAHNAVGTAEAACRLATTDLLIFPGAHIRPWKQHAQAAVLTSAAFRWRQSLRNKCLVAAGCAMAF
eukprot:366441-Chlamydomonas_euryale.AAC.26